MEKEFNIDISEYDSMQAYVSDYMKLMREELKQGYEGDEVELQLSDYDSFSEFSGDFFTKFADEMESFVTEPEDVVTPEDVTDAEQNEVQADTTESVTESEPAQETEANTDN